MKTLTEVIKTLEDCEVRGGFFDWKYGISDALHYLKEYRSDKAMWKADRKGHLDWIEQYKEAREKHQQAVIELKHKEKEINDILTDYVALKQYWAEQQANPALTWEQLQSMEGKPVWVELFGSGLGEWNLCHAQLDDRIWFTDGNGLIFDLSEETLGKTWQAYRKERNE